MQRATAFFRFLTQPGGVMVDLASGPSGYFAPALDLLGPRDVLIATDACPTVISAHADANEDDRIFLFDLDLDRPLPFRDGSIDAFSGNLLCNVTHYAGPLSEVGRCLKPGGRFGVIEGFYEKGSATFDFLRKEGAVFSSLETYIDFCSGIGLEYLGGKLLREAFGKTDPGDLLPIGETDRVVTRTVTFRKRKEKEAAASPASTI